MVAVGMRVHQLLAVVELMVLTAVLVSSKYRAHELIVLVLTAVLYVCIVHTS
jgi:hypothetical protein